MSDQKLFLKFPLYLILIFVILSIGILTTGYLYYKNQEDYITKEKQQELAAIIALKIDQIISWRQERIDFASTIMDDPFLAIRVSDFIKSRKKLLLKKQITERLTTLASFQYQGLTLVDPQGNVRLSVPTPERGLTPLCKIVGQSSNASSKSGFFRPIS